MGKFKDKTSKGNRFRPTGLPSEKECQERELSVMMSPVAGSITKLVEKVKLLLCISGLHRTLAFK